jgi:PhzF family phenazine biosynthesis protein
MLPLRLVDAFTATPFAGNPAGVVRLPAGPILPAWARRLAAEIGASETAFLHPEDDGWRLRWWTPAVEVDLCGHATLAAAHVLWEDELVPPDRPIGFATRAGPLTAVRRDTEIELDLPAWPVAPHPEPSALATALGRTPFRYLGRTHGGQPNDVVEVADEAALRALEPDLAAVAALDTTGLIVTAPADGDDDLVSRYFAPAVGVGEDPVTGSAHSTLGPLWADRLGRDVLTARQLSARGGRLRLRVTADRVGVAGAAVTVVRGEVLGPAEVG